MKKFIFIVTLCLLNIAKGFTQSSDSKKNYLVLYSGKIITSDTLVYKSPDFFADSNIVNEDEVKYYMNQEGRFENMRQIGKTKKTLFRKISSGSGNDNYLLLSNGKLIKAKSIDYRPPFFYVDSMKFKDSEVKFYKNGTVLFANTLFLTKLKRHSNFIKAEKIGKINMFTEYTASNKYIFKTLYYNKGFGELKYAKYKYLKEEMNDNVKCINMLSKIKKRKIISVCIFTVSTLAIPLAIYHFNKENYEGVAYAESLGIITLQLVAAGIKSHEVDKIEKVIEVYNSGQE